MSATSEVVRDLSGIVGASIIVKGIGAVITKVPQGEIVMREHSHRALRRRNTLITRRKAGELYQLRGPGNYFSVLWRGYKPVSTQTFSDNLEDFPLPHKENKQLTVRSTAYWGLASAALDRHNQAPFRFAYNAQSEEARRLGVIGICGASLRKIMMGVSDPEGIDSQDVYLQVLEDCATDLDEEFGVGLRGLRMIASAENMVSAIGGLGVKQAVNNNGNGHHETELREIAAAAGIEELAVASNGGNLHVVPK